MKKKEIALHSIDALKCQYPLAKCSLKYKEPLQLLIATRLAAQCTDKRVNIVTPKLFERFNTAKDFANSTKEEVEPYIKSCGLYKTKAKDIVAMCKMLVDDFNSQVPDNIDDLVKLPGVGRKTANLIVGDVFGKPSYVVDTHCIRITGRLGLHDIKIKDATKIEKILRQLIPEEESTNFCHRIVLHGREICTARKANCDICCCKEFCQKDF